MSRLFKAIVTGTLVGGLFVGLMGAAGTMAGTTSPNRVDDLLVSTSRNVTNTVSRPVQAVVAMAGDLILPDRSAVDLVRFSDDEWTVTAEPGYSLTPLYTRTVRKIAGGVSTLVRIDTTTSGTYSSEGLVSPFVRYPGISVTREADAADPASVAVTQWWTCVYTKSFVICD